MEPVCTPAFDVPFNFKPAESIFTVGSCFARNVEQELKNRGFDLPTREVLSRPEFSKVEAGVLNNFGTPSIFNEFAWAFGILDFDIDDHIIEVAPGKWADMHLISGLRPSSKDIVQDRRAAIREAYRASAKCRVIIMTLGLVEVWYDTKTGFYLNATPRPAVLKANPDRFELRVLDFHETYKFLDDTFKILLKHGHPDLKVVLTVSPVPLASTHRSEDVILANCYSKSLLRVVAETIRAKYDFVTYFPSYESITLSDRKISWLDDQVHVTPEIVALNVGRMVDAFVGSTINLDVVREEVQRGGVAVALEKARSIPTQSFVDADAFFAEHTSNFLETPEFVLAAARHYIARKRGKEAIEVISMMPKTMQDTAPVRAELANAYIVNKDYSRAASILQETIISGIDASQNIHIRLMKAAEDANNKDLMLNTLERTAIRHPSIMGSQRVRMGRWFMRNGNLELAKKQFDNALVSDPTLAAAHIGVTEVLVAMGMLDEAREYFPNIKSATSTDKIRETNLRKILIDK